MMGPLANERRLEAMQVLLDDALTHGATLLAGGARLGHVGNFFAPTVLSNVSSKSKLFNQEPFGPIAAIQAFDSIESVIAEANRLPFGLASYAYTRSLKNAHQLSHELRVGMLWINQPAAAYPEAPFGGVKDSGYGSEGGPEAFDSYLISKSVSVMNV